MHENWHVRYSFFHIFTLQSLLSSSERAGLANTPGGNLFLSFELFFHLPFARSFILISEQLNVWTENYVFFALPLYHGCHIDNVGITHVHPIWGSSFFLQDRASLKTAPSRKTSCCPVFCRETRCASTFRSTSTTSLLWVEAHAQSCPKFPFWLPFAYVRALGLKLNCIILANFLSFYGSWAMGDLLLTYSSEVALCKAHTQCRKKLRPAIDPLSISSSNVPRCNTVRKHAKLRIRNEQSIASKRNATTMETREKLRMLLIRRIEAFPEGKVEQKNLGVTCRKCDSKGVTKDRKIEKSSNCVKNCTCAPKTRKSAQKISWCDLTFLMWCFAPARTHENTRKPARTCENLREPARTCENLREPARTCENLRESARTCKKFWKFFCNLQFCPKWKKHVIIDEDQPISPPEMKQRVQIDETKPLFPQIRQATTKLQESLNIRLKWFWLAQTGFQ